MTALAIDAFIDGLDADDALAVVTAIRDRFGFTGTLFTPEDITSITAAALEERPAQFAAAVTPAISAHVRDGYEYRKLGDILAERGNETLGDAVTQAVGLLEDGTRYGYHPVLYVAVEEGVEAVMDTDAFDDAAAACDWAGALVGHSVRDALAAAEAVDMRTSVRPWRDGAFLDGEVVQVAVAVRQRDQDEAEVARFVLA